MRGEDIVTDGGGRSRIPAHPRMRGEDVAERRAGMVAAGSPPHARGRLFASAWEEWAKGLTPACAGKTPGSPSTR